MNVASIKLEKSVGRQDILFGVARVPGTGRAYVAGSDFKIHEIDIDAPKPEVRTFPGHEYLRSKFMASEEKERCGF